MIVVLSSRSMISSLKLCRFYANSVRSSVSTLHRVVTAGSEPARGKEKNSNRNLALFSRSFTLTPGTAKNDMSDQSSGVSSSDVVEGYVCNESDLNENEMKTFDLPDNAGQVLIVKQNGKISAMGTKCSHYGAPLVKGVLGNGRVRCPWHGACFNITNGDIEDFPGLDNVPCFDVSIESGRVKVKAPKEALKVGKIVKSMSAKCGRNPQTYVIIGGGAAGACAAETLRQEGFTGRIVLLTSELALPYDRIKLSKMLDAEVSKLFLRSDSFYKEHGIDVMQGVIVKGVDTNKKTITLDNGNIMEYSRLLIASGSRANTPTQPGSELKNIFTLRTVQDANRISQALTKESNVVVVGASFIGMEAAAFCLNKVSSVTVVGRGNVPFEPVLGQRVGARIQQFFEEKGVRFLMRKDILSFEGLESVKEIKLSGDTIIPADVVILGIGSQPSTSFLEESGIKMHRGAIIVDQFMVSSVPDVYAAGDAAFAPVFAADGKSASIGHWQLAHYHGRVAARNMVGHQTELQSVPFFWTMLFGTSVRYAGYGAGFDDVIITGDLSALVFIAHYCVGDTVVAVATVGSDPAAAKFAERLALKKKLSKENVQKNGAVWVDEPLC